MLALAIVWTPARAAPLSDDPGLRKAERPARLAAAQSDLASPIHGGIADSLSRLRRDFGLFTNVRTFREQPAKPDLGPKLIKIPQPGSLGADGAEAGGFASLAGNETGTLLLGLVESRSGDSGEPAEGGRRTAVLGAEREIALEQRRLSLQGEIAAHDSDARRHGRSAAPMGNMGYAFRLSGEEPSGALSYGVAFDYVGAGFRAESDDGGELRLRLNGGWRIDKATRLSGYLGRKVRDLGTENPEDGWSAGLAVRRALLPESLPGLTADLGIEVSRSGDAEETKDLVKTRMRAAVGARLAPGLRGRLALITENARDRVAGDERRSNEIRLRLDRDFSLFGATAQLAGETSLRGRSGTDLTKDEATAGLSFTLRDGDDSLTLRGRLVQREDYRNPDNNGLGEELSARLLRLAPFYSAGLEAAMRNAPADGATASYRAGVFLSLAF